MNLHAAAKCLRTFTLFALSAQVALAQESHPQPPPPPAGAKAVKCTGREVPQFTDVTSNTGIHFNHVSSSDSKYVVESMSGGVLLIDYDRDGYPDIYFTNAPTVDMAIKGKAARGALYHNNHDGTFTDVAVMAGVAFNEDGREQAGMGSTIGDYNGDGRLDIFKTNFSDDTSTLYRNNGDGTFDDVTTAAGLGLYTKYLGWGTMFLDVDNDGWPDLLLVNGHVYPEVDKNNLGSNYEEPRILYHNLGKGAFADISAGAGPGISARASSRGLAIGDLWNDGRISAVITNLNAVPSLLVNQVRSANHWIGIRTVGTKSNRDGIGARISVTAGTRTLVDEVRSGSSYNSSSDMRVHFGLGSLTTVNSVQIRWPSGLQEHFDNLPADSIHTLKEGSGTPTASDAKKP